MSSTIPTLTWFMPTGLHLVLTLERMQRAPCGILPYVARNNSVTRRRWLRDFRRANEEGAELNTGLRAAVRDEVADRVESEALRFTFSSPSVKTYAAPPKNRGPRR